MSLRSDQREVAERLLQLLQSNAAVGLMAPTGWGKSYTLAYVAKSIGGRWLWGTSLVSAEYSAAAALRSFNVKYILTAGREKLCLLGLSNIDFRLKNACMQCRYNYVVKDQGIMGRLGDYIDFGMIKEVAMTADSCPYLLQEEATRRMLRNERNIVALMHYRRIPKYIRWADFIVIDEAHSLTLPRIVRLPRRLIEILLDELGIRGIDCKNTEAVRVVLSENLLNILNIAEGGDLDINIDLDAVVDFIDSAITYYDASSDELVGLQMSDLGAINNKRIIYVSATLPPTILSSIPSVRVPPSTIIKVKIPKDAVDVTLENLQYRHRERIAKLLRRYLDNEPTVIFTTSSKDVVSLIEDVTYEDEIGVNVCERPPPILVLNFYGKFSEGYRLTCYRRAILLTVPLLPIDVLRRLRINETDLIVTKTVQVIGRLLPQPEEPDIIMLDRRFWKYCNTLMNYGIQCVED
ncbi:hypothetical protein [Vulcanisaeta sp. JCM 14467]|uniref:hypothetical protein n=1 Tax=Vulcanisaeta sp. JCM 14467 TaxID=1295370 RepID=UPI0006D0DC2F|nr:hypothetical protein [Vulcanisaeta sp. JCM 14467]